MSTTQSLAWRAAELQQALARQHDGLRVQVVPSIASTNSTLLDACRGDPDAPAVPTLLVAEQQTAGRGRQGRSWSSAAGASLTFSLAWPMRSAELSGLSLAVGVGLADALEPEPTEQARIGLKWPNDLWLMEAPATGCKLAGILIETVHRGAQCWAVIGVGINVLPLVVAGARSGVACLREIDPLADAPRTLWCVAPPLVQALQAFEQTAFAGFEARYRRRDLLRGHEVRCGHRLGVAEGVSSSGALRLRCADGVHDIVSGEPSVGFAAQSGATAPLPTC